jgi:hypothetical protein
VGPFRYEKAPLHDQCTVCGRLVDSLHTPENAALLLVDYEPAQLAGVRRMDRYLLVKQA